MAALAALLTSCVTIERDVSVTPGPVPPEIEGARWQSLPVTYCIAAGDSGFVEAGAFAEAVTRAFERWGVDARSDGACDAIEGGNGRNEVGWGDPPESAGGAHQAGYTQLRFRSCPGGCEGGAETRVVEADILIDPDPPQPLETSDCLRATLLHEVGHFLGLPHLEAPAVMAPVTRSCDLDLTEAERAALDSRYGVAR